MPVHDIIDPQALGFQGMCLSERSTGEVKQLKATVKTTRTEMDHLRSQLTTAQTSIDQLIDEQEHWLKECNRLAGELEKVRTLLVESENRSTGPTGILRRLKRQFVRGLTSWILTGTLRSDGDSWSASGPALASDVCYLDSVCEC